MSTKLTLSVDSELIAQAKAYARAHGRSVSELVSNYLQSLVAGSEQSSAPALSPTVQSLVGVFREPEVFDEKEALQDVLVQKYLKS